MSESQQNSVPMELANLKLFVGSLKAPTLLFNHEGVVVFANTAAEQLFGISKKTVIDELFDRFILCPREYSGHVPNYLRDFRENNDDYWGRPLFATHTSGNRLTLDYSLTAYENTDHGNVDLIVFTDITDAHADYHSTSSNLEEESALSKVKTRFLHHIAQEMRMPINNLLNMVGEALDDPGLSSQTLTELDAAYHSGRDLQRSFGELTDFLHLEIGDLDLQRISFNVRAELEGFVDNLVPMARRKNLELATLISPYVPENLVGDPQHIFQVLQSLLNNAFRFTYEGGISVRAICDIETDTHATLQIEVTDTGSGIPEDRVQAIRKSLSAEGGSLAERFKGLGIGLAISKQLMDRMGGKLTIRSTEGLGTTFGMIIQLPKARHVSANKGEVAGRRMLLVNDSMDDRKRLEEYCESWNLSHQVAGHGAQAIGMLDKSLKDQDSAIDYVIIDLHKKKKAGIRLARELRTMERFNHLKIVLLAYASDSITSEGAEKAGINAYVEKPFRKEDLFNALTLVSGQDGEDSTAIVTNHTMGLVEEQQTQRALLVEDNEVNQIIAKGALKKLGISTDVTNNGEEAIDAIQDKHYDIVLMDCEMPIMDGFEATRAIRDWEKSKGTHIPIIALTADETEECREACIQAGMDDFMKKPFRADQLQTILKNINLVH
ncbi:MAG: response regulator [Pseudomonadales bacterium]|nr:response regulator [Pseudomonadales bacterium]